MPYTLTAHKLLSQAALELKSEELKAHQRVAESLLGFADSADLTDPVKKARAEDAIALQISYQVEAGIDAFVTSQVTQGARSHRFRGGSRRMPPIHPMARKLSTALIVDTTVTVR